MTDDMEKYQKEISFEEPGSYLITNQEIEIIPLERFAEFSMRLRLQAANYAMELDFDNLDEGILISWKPVEVP